MSSQPETRTHADTHTLTHNQTHKHAGPCQGPFDHVNYMLINSLTAAPVMTGVRAGV